MRRSPKIAAVLMALLTLWSASAGPVLAAVHAGDPAPDFRGTDLGGVSRRLSDYHGKVVVLFVLGNT